MKVYVVTDGYYSDYTIEKVFSNKPAAEEFKKWRNIRNEIEEYEVYDEPFEQNDGENVMFIRVQGTVYPEAVVDIKYETRPDLINSDRACRSGGGIMEYIKPGVFTLYNYHYISIDQWDEERHKAKFTKALYDQASIVKAMFAEGASVHDVEQALREREIEDI